MYGVYKGAWYTVDQISLLRLFRKGGALLNT